jgi:anti-anti-sigma regulatory factor
MDAGTLDLVVAARNRQRANGCDLYLSNAAPIVRRVVGLCGLDDLLG